MLGIAAQDETANIVLDKNEKSTEKEKDDKIEEVPLNDEILQALGDDPSENKSEPLNLHSTVEKRWKHWFSNGIEEQEKEKMLKKYPGPSGMEAPVLNPIVVAILQEQALKRDQHIFERQKYLVSVLSILGSATNDVLESVADNEISQFELEFIEKLDDPAKLVHHTIFDQTGSRKAFIYPGVDKKNKTLLEKSKTD